MEVSTPIELQNGKAYSLNFESNHNGYTIISVEIERNISSKIVKCLLGIRVGWESEKKLSDECKESGIDKQIASEWVVYEGNRVISQGNTIPWGWGGAFENGIKRELGHFDANKGKVYRIDIKILSDIPDLETVHPRLVVEAHPSVYRRGMCLVRY